MKNIAKREYKGIPDNAKKVFEGEIYDVYHWEQEMFDGSKEIFEKIIRPDTVSIFAIVGDKIILQEQVQPHRSKFISIPGGRCDKGEQVIESAKRELLEETGYASDEYVPWKTLERRSTVVYNKHYYIARNCMLVQKPVLDSGEKIENKLVSFDGLISSSDDERFRDMDLMRDFYYLRLHPEKMEEFKKLLFSN